MNNIIYINTNGFNICLNEIKPHFIFQNMPHITIK